MGLRWDNFQSARLGATVLTEAYIKWSTQEYDFDLNGGVEF
jgi:hypothetical protein